MAGESASEPHLSGKQLVFLFMASTVVAVVVFLCGVMVGRGVPVGQGAGVTPAIAAAGRAGSTEQPEPALATPLDTPIAGADSPADALTYSRRLGGDEPVEEELSDPAPARKTGLAATPGSTLASQAVPDTPATSAGLGRADGFVVQVAALRGGAAAEAMAEQLLAKGYPAYVLEPFPNAPAQVYRVQVGKYADRHEAEQVMRRLEQEEQFTPWITR